MVASVGSLSAVNVFERRVCKLNCPGAYTIQYSPWPLKVYVAPSVVVMWGSPQPNTVHEKVMNKSIQFFRVNVRLRGFTLDQPKSRRDTPFMRHIKICYGIAHSSCDSPKKQSYYHLWHRSDSNLPYFDYLHKKMYRIGHNCIFDPRPPSVVLTTSPKV